ncbi:g11019 [Coccomyxa elongata]
MIVLSSLPGLTTVKTVQGYELLFYGDSITETWRGSTFDVAFAARPAIHAQPATADRGHDWYKRSGGGFLLRTLGVLHFLREENPGAHIVALAVLPRGWTDAWHIYDWPSMYKGGIDVINRALKDFAAQDDAVTYLDCGPALLPDGKIHPEFMPDALHPNADGMELFARCLSPLVDKLMERTNKVH